MQLYNNFKNKIPLRDIPLSELATIIRTDEQLKAATTMYRQQMMAGDEVSAKVIKESTPQVAAHFVMDGNGKGEESCQKPTGYVLIDFDAKGKDAMPQADMQKIYTILRTSYHCALGYESISGKGYHIIVPYVLPDGVSIDIGKDAKHGKEVFRRVYLFIAKTYSVHCGHDMDMQCANINRFCGLAHDPMVCFREDVRPFYLTKRDLGILEDGSFIKPASKKTRQNSDGSPVSIPLGENLDTAVGYVEASGIRFAVGYRHDYLVRLSFMLNRLGIDEEEAGKALDDKYGTGFDERPSKILHSCYTKCSDEHGIWLKARDTKAQRVAAFLSKQQLRYDIIKRKLNIYNDQWRELSDRDLNNLYYACCCELKEDVSMQLFRPLLNSALVPQVNPLTSYLDGLTPWTPDMPDYIDETAKMVKTTDVTTNTPNLWQTCFKKWFVAMVAGWMNEDVVNHQVLVLIGKQGIYKTTFLDKLIPPQLANYRSKQTMMERIDKDEQLRAAEYGLINLDEIDKLSDRGLNELKSLITNTQIDVRAAYGYSKEKRVRIASYVASGNKDQFLSDLTGNRRWLPFHVESIDDPWSHKYPYDGMYAQAVYLIRSGYNYWFTADDVAEMETHTQEFMTITREEDLLDVYFEPWEAAGAQMLTSSEILAKLKAYGNISREASVRTMGMILKKHGFRQLRRDNNRYWLVRERDVQELSSQRTITQHPSTTTHQPSTNTPTEQILPF